jgi:hypothetical protein
LVSIRSRFYRKSWETLISCDRFRFRSRFASGSGGGQDGIKDSGLEGGE